MRKQIEFRKEQKKMTFHDISKAQWPCGLRVHFGAFAPVHGIWYLKGN
jgi:hypothetical protein